MVEAGALLQSRDGFSPTTVSLHWTQGWVRNRRPSPWSTTSFHRALSGLLAEPGRIPGVWFSALISFANGVSLTWKHLLGRDPLLSLLSADVLLQYSGLVLSQILFQEKVWAASPACLQQRREGCSCPCYFLLKPPSEYEVRIHTPWKTCLRTTFVTVLTVFVTHTVPDLLACKHTEAVTCRTRPDLSTPALFPQPLLKQKDHLCNDPSTKGFYLEHRPVCHFLLETPISGVRKEIHVDNLPRKPSFNWLVQCSSHLNWPDRSIPL